METMLRRDLAGRIHRDLRLRSLPLGVRFFEEGEDLPAEARHPRQVLKKRITVCQAVTMARIYGWCMAVSGDDVICPPGATCLGLIARDDPREDISQLFARSGWCKDEDSARAEVAGMAFSPAGKARSLVVAPVEKASFKPHVLLFYGNPAQIMRLVQGWCWVSGNLIESKFGGKVECADYLLAPWQENKPRVVLPGMGDRIFGMVQDDEMAFALPDGELKHLSEGLDNAGAKMGARYPVTPYLNFEPEFPPAHQELGKDLGMY